MHLENLDLQLEPPADGDELSVHIEVVVRGPQPVARRDGVDDLQLLLPDHPHLCLHLKYRVPKKSGISDMMIGSVEGPVGTIGRIEGTQKMFPVRPKYTLRSYLKLFVSL